MTAAYKRGKYLRVKQSMYVNPGILEPLYELYDRQGRAIDAAAESYVLLRRRALALIKLTEFTRDELIGLLKLYEGYPLDRSNSFRHLIAARIDDDAFGSKIMYNVDHRELSRKIETMDELAAFFLIEEILRYYHVPGAYGAYDSYDGKDAFIRNLTGY